MLLPLANPKVIEKSTKPAVYPPAGSQIPKQATMDRMVMMRLMLNGPILSPQYPGNARPNALAALRMGRIWNENEALKP